MVEGGVGGEEGVAGLGDVDVLVAGDDVAQPTAAVHDVVPCQFATLGLGGEAVEYEIANQPRGGGGQPEIGGEAVALGVLDDALGDVERHGADDAVGEDGYGFAADIVPQPDVYAVWKLFDFDRGNVAGSGRVETPLRLFG